MKSYLHILLLSSLFASCTSAYKSGQTPDDVYFSPASPKDEYVRVDDEEDRYRRDDEAYRDDRYLRMKVRNRRWSTLDDDYYSYSYGTYGSYGYYPYVYNTPFNSISYWNYYYNPYCPGNTVIISNPKSTVYSRPRTFNMGVFTSPGTNTGSKAQTRYGYTGSSGSNNNSKSSGRNAGSYLRDIFGSSSGDSRSKDTYSTNTRSSSGSSSSGSSGSSSSSSGGRGNASLRKN